MNPDYEASKPDTGETGLPMNSLARRGDVAKCPVCGTGVDPESYHGSQCRNYFCFHCRARLLDAGAQLQCLNQSCDYYAKLICGVCDPAKEKEEPPSIYAEPEDGYWPLWLATNRNKHSARN